MNKMKRLYKYAFAGFLLVGVSGCELFSDFGDTNVNPAATTEPILSALLTNVGAQMGSYAFQTRPGLYSQYFSQTQYTDESLYSLPQLSFTGNYSGPLQDLQTIINANQSNNMTQVARILQQYIYWTITDRWGDIPYSEALTGVNTAPAYDTQEDVYRGMLSTLADAVNSFDNASLISGDVIYAGDVASWKRAANSLRMLMALQLSERFPDANGYAATEFKAALNHSAGYISTNAENFDVAYPGGNFPSDYWSLYNGRRDYAESATMTSLMGSLSDLRQNAFGGANDLANQANSNASSNVGVPYGLARANAEAFTGANTNWARILRGDLRTQSSTVYIITAAHVALARAEAANLGWTTENVTDVYNAGIRFSFEQWGITMPNNYLTQAGVQLGTDNARKIAIQRYIAFYPDGLQGWNIWRKTGYPELTPAPAATNAGGQIPRRYVYAQSEYATNEAAVNAAAARLTGGDTQDARVWWDVQ
ncbi:SusD/RagB family nutrient-binding outer membrane lipoprotein [Pontibacter sp. SGAir0037]|uniref:SusD/RagB family nutrient-binding outer membrane lipoprotein n=1 Tax=Pontibacter sp. SGAir0037 TaxID=2571030 RepID=UPI0010CD186B|nr:SusD/RagB family nutrient-binding outer membrane lipoprotein [Pontibacter sp. SGAir0037]QCR24283.1 hypothetical protein C1N53_19260 [Pontibacter sp. SGAir0037]